MREYLRDKGFDLYYFVLLAEIEVKWGTQQMLIHKGNI